MGSATGLSINTVNIDHSEGVAGDHSTLIEGKSILSLSLSLIHKGLRDTVTLHNQTVAMILDSNFFFLGQTLVVSNVYVGLLCGLLSTSLPAVGSEHFTARSKDEMSAGMVSLQLHSPLHVDLASDALSNNRDFFFRLFVFFWCG